MAMVQLSINDFTSGEFKVTINQNALIHTIDFDEKIKEIITKAFGLDFADDYYLAGNENKYNAIEVPFAVKHNGKTYWSKGLKFMLQAFIYSDYTNLITTSQIDNGAVVSVNEAAASNRFWAVKYHNQAVKELDIIVFQIEKEYSIEAINDYYKYDAAI